MLRSPGKRRVRLRGCFNFRDLGGYETGCGLRTRYQRLFRSDGLHLLTAADQDEVARLGVATVIDLRTPEEVMAEGRARVRAARYQLPMADLLSAPSGVGPWHAEAGPRRRHLPHHDRCERRDDP